MENIFWIENLMKNGEARLGLEGATSGGVGGRHPRLNPSHPRRAGCTRSKRREIKTLFLKLNTFLKLFRLYVEVQNLGSKINSEMPKFMYISISEMNEC